MRITTRIAAVGLSLFSSASALVAQDINTGPPTSGPWTAVGPGWFNTTGQIFSAGGNYLNSFSFWFGPGIGRNWTGAGDANSGVLLRPFVMAWDGNSVSGPVLYQGADVAIQGLTSFQRYDFQTGDLLMTPGMLYAAFVQSVFDGVHTGNVGVGWNLTGTGAIATNLQGSVAQPLTQPWSAIQSYGGSFAADFSNAPVNVVPEPATLALMATGVASLAGFARRRRAKP